jgi:hypothetical protein
MDLAVGIDRNHANMSSGLAVASGEGRSGRDDRRILFVRESGPAEAVVVLGVQACHNVDRDCHARRLRVAIGEDVAGYWTML